MPVATCVVIVNPQLECADRRPVDLNLGVDDCELVSGLVRVLDNADQLGRHHCAELLPMVYQELRRLATWVMARESPGQTLQPTALVHEAYLRLLQGASPRWSGRKHFFNAAAEAMRRILVERARRKGRLKRGGGWKRVPLEELESASEADPGTLLLVEAALERLRGVDSFKAELVKLRFFVGLDNKELAHVLEVSEPTVKRHWTYARAWLYQELVKVRNE